ncbi:hypothetical protein JX265_013305 [Neoarthrinium moseri]|uniref:mRNA N(6)-methyladenine demethylase n=1 Tax=Neoarthrinium moseri TaxID=1658444 RepID=A0A9Q0AG13_9PEZI|nr:uncharacterized protein JN550_013345 [Neoarthrinium moseri]KAI1843423.1 hypothetical protein JX266_010420 [Neoarthrinium moseri]KAI1850825.1 hypothetical protein JX265_013305 [Neoarthrinium moseri]KAI1857262.1 hypothetical protein JN550_013345 [Neoarthrinium moseri]
MAVDLQSLDAHEQPSDELRALWKSYQKTDHAAFVGHPDIDELPARDAEDLGEFRLSGRIPSEEVRRALQMIGGAEWEPDGDVSDAPLFHHPILPGLLLAPGLIPPSTQKTLLSRMVHRDLSNPTHQTNLHLHYDLPYLEAHEDSSFFSLPPESDIKFVPKDPTVHKPLSIKQVMERKLSWVTLGGQYDWTNRVYPEQGPPNFPHDIAGFLQTLFPATLAQAAIVNFYSPGDTMMMHRDVSEETNKGLVSLSIGCDALFMIAPNTGESPSSESNDPLTRKPYLLLRLRSGDAIYMSEESRYAWHGVPKVLKGTCPDYLADWPAEDGKYESWKGWMRNKRINLNVRQMRD